MSKVTVLYPSISSGNGGNSSTGCTNSMRFVSVACISASTAPANVFDCDSVSDTSSVGVATAGTAFVSDTGFSKTGSGFASANSVIVSLWLSSCSRVSVGLSTSRCGGLMKTKYTAQTTNTNTMAFIATHLPIDSLSCLCILVSLRIVERHVLVDFTENGYLWQHRIKRLTFTQPIGLG